MERLANNEPRFKSKIIKWIDLSHQKNFYHYCDTFDSIIYDNLTREIDFGEAGAIAQAEKTRVFWFISDDSKNISFIKRNYSHIRQHSIFFLVALADISGLLPNYESVLIDILHIRKYHEFTPEKRKKLKALIRNDYISVLQLKGHHTYLLDGISSGVYSLKIVSDKYLYSSKIISTNSLPGKIELKNTVTEPVKDDQNTASGIIKLKELNNTSSLKDMQYNTGDTLMLT